METRPRPTTRTISKTPSILRLRWPVSERCELQRTELGDGTRRNLMSLPSQPHSPRDDYSPFPTVLAATNKCLAKSNKTRTARGATKKRFKQAIRRRSGAGYKTRAPSRAHHAEDSDHRDCAATDARPRAAFPATPATEAARPMVPGGLDGERQLLRTGLPQGAGRYPQKRLVPARLARERQLLHPLRVRSDETNN